MSNAETATLVFKDQAGEYYVLPLEALERGRVPAEQKVALEEQLAAMSPASDEGDDVQGYLRCEDATQIARIYGLTSLVLFQISNATYHGTCR
jgi:hypothetical protein